MHACLSQRVRVVLSMALCSAPALVLQATGQSAALAAGAAASVSPCGPNQVAIGLASGLPGMHRVTVLIEVRNTSPHPCDLVGPPSVSALDSNGRIGETAGGSPPEPASTRTSRSSLTLDPGETASAQVVAISPVAPTTSCPSYPELSVRLWSSGPSRVFKEPLPGCSPGFAVTSFVPGFNGTSPTGELVGTAPVCKPPARSAPTTPAAVEVDVWSGRTLAGSTTVFATNAPKRYQIVLAPGRYRVTSSHTRSRQVTVKLGRTENVGRFGGCSTLTTQTTIPGRGAVTTTTRPTPATPADRLTKITFLNPSAGSQPKSTVRSTDGGRTWTKMTPCPHSSSLTFGCTIAQPLSFGYLGEIDAVTGDTVFLVGGRNSLLVTHDGRVSWHVVHPMIGDTCDGSWNVSFFNRSNGVVPGSNPQDAETPSIWSTADGGATWRSVVPTESTATTVNSPRFAATSASFTSTQLGWVLGTSPCGKNLCTSLVHTTDGGNTWRRIPAPPAPVNSSTRTGVSELHFANDIDGYAFGGSALWVTHDGGGTGRINAHLPGSSRMLSARSSRRPPASSRWWPAPRANLDWDWAATTQRGASSTPRLGRTGSGPLPP